MNEPSRGLSLYGAAEISFFCSYIRRIRCFDRRKDRRIWKENGSALTNETDKPGDMEWRLKMGGAVISSSLKEMKEKLSSTTERMLHEVLIIIDWPMNAGRM